MTWRLAPLTLPFRDVEVKSVGVGVESESNTQLGAGPVVEPLADSGQELKLRVMFTGQQASLHTAETAELLGSTAHQPIAVEAESSHRAGLEGYYVAGSTGRSPTLSQPGDNEDTERLTPTLTRAGTRDSVWLSVEATLRAVDHAWGNDTTPRIAIPAVAGKRLWYDSWSGTLTTAGDPIATRTGEHGDLDVYDVPAGEQAVGTTGVDRGPSLLFELAYSDAGVFDPVVWDASEGPDGDASSSDYSGFAPKYVDGERRWMYVFSPRHEFGAPVLDTGLLRVYVDEDAGELIAEEWDTAASEWSQIGLDWTATDWQLFDWSVLEVSPTSIRSQAVFEHPTDGLYMLDAALDRGADLVRWSNPRNEDPPVPSGLATVLDPIASSEVVDPQPVRELVQRSEAQR